MIGTNQAPPQKTLRKALRGCRQFWLAYLRGSAPRNQRVAVLNYKSSLAVARAVQEGVCNTPLPM
jgi:hypothetical protein